MKGQNDDEKGEKEEGERLVEVRVKKKQCGEDRAKMRRGESEGVTACPWVLRHWLSPGDPSEAETRANRPKPSPS